MRSTWLLSVSMVLAAMAVSCSGSDSESEEHEEEGVELQNFMCPTVAPTYAEVTAFAKCTTCHASTKMGADRQAAPLDDNFDTEAAALPKAGEAAEEVSKGDMPPPASGITLTEEEKQTLYAWALCR